MLKMRLITLAVTAAPFAFLLAKVCLGTKAGGMNDGGAWL